MIFPCPRACLRIWSREMGSAVPSRVSLLISILRLNLVLTYGIPPEFRGGVHMKPPYAIGSVPSLSGHAIAYRWRSLPRVRRHRASKPQGSSERVLPWQITMDQLIFASLSHTHYWYEVGMLKVPAWCTNDPIVLHPLGIFILFSSFLVRKIPIAGIELRSQRVRGLRGTSELPGRPATHYNIYIYIYIYYIVQKGYVNCICMYIHLNSWVLERNMPLRPRV